MSREATWALGDEPLLSIGVEVGEEPYMFTEIGDMAPLPDGSLAVAEREAREIRVFDQQGSFVDRFGGRGQGPGEFEWVGAVGVEGDTIRVYDAMLRRLSVFGLDGELVETVSPPTGLFEGGLFSHGYFSDGSLLGSIGEETPPPDSGVMEGAEKLVRWSPEDPDRLDTLVTFEVGRMYIQAVGQGRAGYRIPMVPPPARVRAAGQRHAYATTGEFLRYRRYALDGTLDRIVRVSGSPQAISDDYLREFKERRIQSEPEPRRSRLRAVYEEMPFPDRFPMVDTIRLDSEENVWLRRYGDPLADEGSRVWHVFDPDGIWIGTIHTPPSFELRLITGERVFGVWRNEMDVQSVRVYGIERGVGRR